MIIFSRLFDHLNEVPMQAIVIGQFRVEGRRQHVPLPNRNDPAIFQLGQHFYALVLIDVRHDGRANENCVEWHIAKRRDLLAYCFDPMHAHSIGLPVRLLHYGLLILLALTIVASLRAVGIILVVAMLIAPGAIAYLLTNRFERMMALAVAVAVGSSAVGTLVSFHIDGATGPCIVLVQMAVFVAAFTYVAAFRKPRQVNAATEVRSGRPQPAAPETQTSAPRLMP